MTILIHGYQNALLVLAVLTTCATGGTGPQPTASHRALLRTTADTSSASYKQFAAYLSLAIATRVPHEGRIDSVYTCDMEEARREMRWVADYRILSVETVGDSGRATAVIGSVARQIDDGYGWTARYGIREDTAHWTLERRADAGNRWKVCGDAMEGFGVFHVGRDVKWVNGSKAAALAAVDSLRRARGLPLVR